MEQFASRLPPIILPPSCKSPSPTLNGPWGSDVDTPINTNDKYERKQK